LGVVEGTADPSTSLRFGRDDKGEGGASIEIGGWLRDPQVPRLRYPGFPVEFSGFHALHAAFIEESRLKFADPTKLDRNSG
jgi:hypothetical protein